MMSWESLWVGSEIMWVFIGVSVYMQAQDSISPIPRIVQHQQRQGSVVPTANREGASWYVLRLYLQGRKQGQDSH